MWSWRGVCCRAGLATGAEGGSRRQETGQGLHSPPGMMGSPGEHRQRVTETLV